MAEVARGLAVGRESSLVSLITSTAAKSSLPIPRDLDDPTSSSQAYLLSLTSQSLVELRGQPAALSTAKSSLNTQLSSLCSQHVSSFVQVHHATSSLPLLLVSLDSALESLIKRDLPALSNVAQQFSQQVEAPLLAKEKAQNITLQYELSLKDLLDIPRLLMTCVRANHPVEALQLAAHMMRIGAQSDESNVHRALQEECWIHLKKLREDLLRALGARGLRLPAAKRLVSLLRKFKEVDEANRARGGDLDSTFIEKLSLSDSTVCLSFLQSRWSLIEEITSNATSTMSTSALSLHLSTWRDIVGDSCGMAQALFASAAHNEQDELSTSSLVSIFCHQSLTTLRQLLFEVIPWLREEATSFQESLNTLSTLHTQLSYSAASLSRQGLEISRIVSGQEIFHLEVVTLWKRALLEKKIAFERCRQGKIITDHSSWVTRGNVQEVLQQPLSDYSTHQQLSVSAKQFPDLVVFINGVLECYNALLSFAPMTTGKKIMSALDETFVEVVKPLYLAIQANERVELNLSLSPIISTDGQSRYYEQDTARQTEANSAILGRVLTILCGPAMDHVRGLLRELYESGEVKQSDQLSTLRKEALKWAKKAEDIWKKGEKMRKEKVRLEEEEILAEEKRKRKEEEARQAEMEKRRKEKELKQAEMEKKKIVEEEARKRKEEEEATMRLAAAEEEAARKQQELEKLNKEKEAEEQARLKEAQRIKEEKEAQRVKKEEEKAKLKDEEKKKELREQQEAEEKENLEKEDLQTAKLEKVEVEKEAPNEEQTVARVEEEAAVDGAKEVDQDETIVEGAQAASAE